jgi:hypothetical protein
MSYIGSKRSSSLVSATEITLDGAKLKSSGDSITKSDGTTAVLSESSGVVTVTTNNAVIEGSSSGDLVRITQTGSGNALVVEDETNPDSSPFVVNSSGNVGIGTSSPNSTLHVAAPTVPILTLERNNNVQGNGVITNQGNTGARQAAIQLFITTTIFYSNYDALTETMRIDSSGALILAGSTAQKATGTTWSNPSDQRLKSNISDYPKGTAELMQVRVREWEYNGKGGTVAGTKGLGVIADEIMTVLPNTVDNYEAKLNVDDEETTQIKKFDATEITWLLVKTTQEQQTLIESQQSQIDTLTTKTQEQDLTIASLISRIEALETQP